MNVCIVGGGHIGTTLACFIKQTKKEMNVRLYTRRPEQFRKKIKCNDIEKKESYEVELDTISDKPSVAAAQADIVFIALPHFAVEKAFADISPYVSDDAFIGVLPGGGGCEFFFEKYFKKTVTLFGFQRVPFIARLVEYGTETDLKSWKPYSVVGTLYGSRADEACQRIEACGLKTKQSNNYLCIALTPTNPVLHTARVYELFGGFDREHIFKEKSLFYVGWTDKASEILFGVDKELHDLLACIPEVDTTAIKALSVHYESPTVQKMTDKINSIPSFQSIYAPLKAIDKKAAGYIADTESRMFTEDFPWGLAIMRAFCDILGVDAPTMDVLLKWYSNYMNYEWYIGNEFKGKDLVSTGVPQRYGITTREKLLEYYLK